MGEISQDCPVAEFFYRLSVQDFKIFKKFIRESRDKGFVEGMAMERSEKINKPDAVALVKEMLTGLVWLHCIEEKHYKKILEDFKDALEESGGE